MSIFMVFPLEICMDTDLQLMNVLAVANQGLAKIKVCPPRQVLGCNTGKSVGYSQESTDKKISSRTLYGCILYRSASSSIVGVGLMLLSPNSFVVYLVVMFIAMPILMRVLGMIIFAV
jgi:hypothetical protein